MLKYKGRPLWQGKLPDTTTLQMLNSLFRFTLSPLTGGSDMRYVVLSQQRMPETTLAQLPMSSSVEATIIHVSHPMHGGGGAKVQFRVAQQSALASTLLHQGYPLRWVTDAVDQIMRKVNVKRIEPITNMMAGSAKLIAIETLCKEAGVDFPEQTTPARTKVTQGAPWNKQKKKRLEGHQLDVSGYRLVEGFFTNEDDTPTPQITTVKPQSTGLCLLSHAAAAQWIQAGVPISADELGIIVPGKMDTPKTLTSVDTTFPCYDEKGDMLLIAGQLVQLGQKHIQIHAGDAHQIKEDPARLVAFTLYRQDWSEDSWKRATTQTATFIREQLAQDSLEKSVLSLWGRSMRNNKSPAPPSQCTTVQMHGSVEATKLPALLGASGFNFVFCLPKLSNDHLD